MEYKIKDMNGLKVIFAPMKDANSITVQVFVKAGSVYETKTSNGISHFLEHMFFKGGEKYKTPKAVAEAVESFGGKFNAYTSDEEAAYYIKCAPMFVEKAVDVLADMMICPKFSKDELDREKGVVIQEIMMRQDEPSRLVYDLWKKFFFGNNSYGWSTLGLVENIKAFDQDTLFAHKHSLYTKDNLILVVAGRIENQKDLENIISEAFKKLPEGKVFDKPKFVEKLPKMNMNSYKKKTEQNHLIISANGFNGTHPQKFAANMLATILGGNMSSRLFQNIREKEGLCYYIGGSHYTSPESGIFMFRAGIEKGRFDYGIKRIHEEIEKIANGDINKIDLEKTLGYTVGQIQMGIESSDEMAEFIGEQYLLYGKIDTLEDILDSYKKVTLKDLINVASKLKEDNRFSFWIE